MRAVGCCLRWFLLGDINTEERNKLMITNEEKKRLHVQLLCATLSGPAIDLGDDKGPRPPTDCLEVLIESCADAVNELAQAWEARGWIPAAEQSDAAQRVPTSGKEGAAGWTLERFEALLVESGVIPQAAIEDAAGYDMGMTKRALGYVYYRLQKAKLGGGETA